MTFFDQKLRQRRTGFTMIELVVASVVLVILFSVVLARFHSGQNTGDLTTALRQVIDGVTGVRSMSMSGQLINGSVPSGGYGIHFDLTVVPGQYRWFGNDVNGDPQYLTNGTRILSGTTISQLCGSIKSSVTTKPCNATDWQDAGNTLDIIFPLAGGVVAKTVVPQPYTYVGGILTNPKTNQRVYFYVSLLSGLVTGDKL